MVGISALYINGRVVLRVSDATGDTLSELQPDQAVQLARHLLSAAARSSLTCTTIDQLTESLLGISRP